MRTGVGYSALSILCGEAMRRPVFPGWAKKQTPTPFLCLCGNNNQKTIADFGVFAGNLIVVPDTFQGKKMRFTKRLLSLLVLTFVVSTFISCDCGDDDVFETNSIGGFYFFINETSNDSIDNYDARDGKRLVARNGDSLSLTFKSALPDNDTPMKCRMTFVLPDGSRHVVEDTNNHDMAYGYVVRNEPLGNRMLQIVPEVIDKKVKYTGDSIVIFRMSIVE